jgi:hypothetical protein
MTETIHAEAPPLREPGFATADEAIKFAKAIQRRRCGTEADRCVGRRIECVDWRPEVLALHLDNGKVLEFRCADDTIDLAVTAELPGYVRSATQLPSAVLLRLGPHEFSWNRGELAGSLAGKTVIKLTATVTGYFIEVTEVGTLFLNTLVDSKSASSFVFFEASD